MTKAPAAQRWDRAPAGRESSPNLGFSSFQLSRNSAVRICWFNGGSSPLISCRGTSRRSGHQWAEPIFAALAGLSSSSASRDFENYRSPLSRDTPT
jgi:hypothetical protein